MRNVFSGSFKQVKDKVSKDSAQYGIHFIQDFGTFHMLFFFVFFIGGTYGLYGVNYYSSNYMEEAVIPLDLNNEYISFPPSIWIAHVTTLIFFLTGIIARRYSKRHNAKGFFLYNLFAAIGLFPFIIEFFIMGQLFVTSFFVRVLYTVFFVMMCIFVPIKVYKNAVKFVFDIGEKHLFEKWLTRQAKWLMAILTAIAGPYYFLKTISDSAGDFETVLIGSMVGYFPLIAGLALLFYLYFFNYILRSFYLYKYSEEFMEKFGASAETWYGDEKFVEEEEKETEKAE